MSLHQTKTAFTVFGTFWEPGDRRFSVHFSLFLISLLLSFPFVYLFFFSRPRQRNELLCCELSWKKERRRFCGELTRKEKKSLKRFYIILPSYWISCHFPCSFGCFLLRLTADYFNWTVSFSMERNGQTEGSASDGSQNHDRPFCLKCALLCNILRFQLFFLNFRKTKEKMQIKGRIQSWNVFYRNS